jgi:hypothetical protein
MQNRYKIIEIIIIFGLILGCNRHNDHIPAEFSQHIHSLIDSVEYKTVIPYNMDWRTDPSKAPPEVCPKYFSGAEAIQDIDMVVYLLQTTYCKCDYWEKKGVNFLALGEEAKKKFDKLNNDRITLAELEKTIHSILNAIRDGHIELWGTMLPFQPYKHKNIYFSDVLVESKDTNVYQVIDSKIGEISRGDKFTETDFNNYLFRTLSPKNTSQYLIGILSEEDVSEQTLSFNNKSIALPFHEGRINKAKIVESGIVQIEEVNQVTILNVKSFSSNHESSMQKLLELGKKLKDTNSFILNLFDNSGGTTLYPEKFIRSLNDYADWKGTCSAKLWSPASIQFYLSSGPFTKNVDHYIQFSERNFDKFKNAPVKEWNLYPYHGNQHQTGTYKGTMVVLVNRNVGSAAESAITLTRSVKNSILVGENTRGAGSSGEMAMFYFCQIIGSIHHTQSKKLPIG